jgi:hypothetical protein
MWHVFCCITSRHILTLSAVCQAQSNSLKVVGFEVFTVVTIKNAIFWDVAPEERAASTFRVEKSVSEEKC